MQIDSVVLFNTPTTYVSHYFGTMCIDFLLARSTKYISSLSLGNVPIYNIDVQLSMTVNRIVLRHFWQFHRAFVSTLPKYQQYRLILWALLNKAILPISLASICIVLFIPFWARRPSDPLTIQAWSSIRLHNDTFHSIFYSSTDTSRICEINIVICTRGRYSQLNDG